MNEGQSTVEALIAQHQHEWRASTAGTDFIEGVRNGSLDATAFERWLVQDRLFVLGLVDAQLRIATRLAAEGDGTAPSVLFDGVRGLEEELEWFVRQGDARGLELDVAPVEDCAKFVAYLHSLTSAPPAVALVALWCLERAYLDAWNGARPCAEGYREFVDHWSNEEFSGYVDRLQDAADHALETASADERERAVDAFERVMDFERRFWRMAETGA